MLRIAGYALAQSLNFSTIVPLPGPNTWIKAPLTRSPGNPARTRD